ncbi:MAG: hypothetical protein IKI22_03320 [Neisseriaceae bacterium]|nr:hypothetical protein [Neisseriaceae bacterium]
MCQVKSKKAAIFPRLSPIAALIASLATPFSFADYVGCNLDSSNNCYGVSPSYSVSISDENANEVAGRLESDNDADNSTVSVEGNSSVSTVFGGKSSNAGANYNEVTITGNTNQFGTIYGGYSESDNENALLNENRVFYKSEGTVEKIYGAFADAGKLKGNRVEIDIANPTVQVSDSIYGGFSNKGDVFSSRVWILDGTAVTVGANVIGAHSNSGSLNNNVVSISDGATLKAINIIGAEGGKDSSEISSNGVSIYSTVSANLIAGAKGASDYFEGGWVNIGGGGAVTATEGIYGAYKDGPSSGNINQKFKMILNKVEIKNNATVDANVYGAKAEDDVYIEKNRVLITNNSTVNGNVYAGYSAAAGLVESNDIALLGSSNAPDLIAGFSENGDVVRNQVWVNNSNAGSVIAGASNGNGEVRENIVVIEGGSVDAVHGGLATLGGAIENNVEITAGVIKGDVYGGVSVSDKARKNAVIVNGGSFLNPNGKIYAGVVKNSGEATDNTISLGSSLDANALSNVVLYGGFVGGTGDAISANTLAVQGKGITVAGIENFENLYFILPENIGSNERVLTVVGSNPTNFSQAVNVGVAMAGNSNIALKNGEKVTLLHNNNGLLNANGDPLRNGTDYKNASLPSSIPGVQGFSLVYNFRLSNDDTNIFATVDNSIPVVTPSNPQPVKQADEPVDITPQPLPATPSVREETKAVAESRLSTAAILNLASDHVLRATKFLQNNTDANVNGEVLPEKLFTPFLLSSLHRQKIRTGSHVKANGASTIVGGVWQTKLAKSNVNAGAFVEFGKGSHQTFN